jgi:HSP20 family protein
VNASGEVAATSSPIVAPRASSAAFNRRKRHTKGINMSLLTLWNRRQPVTSVPPMNGGLVRLRDEMDRTFDRFFSEPFGMIEPKMFRTDIRGGWFPAIDVSETDSEVTIRAEVPGIAAKELDISISGTTLTISGQKEEQDEQKGEDYYQCERRFGSFRRMIELPEAIDADKVTAESDNGLVTIHVAKKAGVKPRKVEVKPTSKKVAVTG